MGCGRVGATLAAQLDSYGHSVAVIDRSSDAFRRLPADFSGRKVKGMGFDRDSLEQAGIDDAYAFAAVSNGDNSNILAARVARETFGVEHVVARIYDARRADVYERLGIPSVATVRWTTEQIMSRMLPNTTSTPLPGDETAVVMVQLSPHPAWVGMSIGQIERRTEMRVAWLTRGSAMIVANDKKILQDGDLLHCAVTVSQAAKLRRTLSKAPVKEF